MIWSDESAVPRTELLAGVNRVHRRQLVVIFADEVFRKKRLFVTVTPNGLNLVTKSPGFGLSIRDLTGKLIIGNSPLQNNSWSGQLRGLAIYRSELNAAQVTEHYEDWTQKGKPNGNPE